MRPPTPPSSITLLQLLSLLPFSSLANPSPKSSTSDEKPLDPCTIIAPLNGGFYNLNALTVHEPREGHKNDRNESWSARGWDYRANFTINFCAPVIEKLEDVVGVDKDLWGSVAAYYTMNGETYSIGRNNSAPIFRGRKLILNYTDGSPCEMDHPKSLAKRSESFQPELHSPHEILPRKIIDDDDDDDDKDDSDKDDEDPDKDPKSHKKPDHDDDSDPSSSRPSHKPSSSPSSTRLKSTIIEITCDTQPVTTPKTHISFLAAPDNCYYFFEAKSSQACASTPSSSTGQSVGPGSVFGLIVLIAIGAYLLGGIAYQRNVMHQRGWRQLPNYALWAGMVGFVGDVVVILFGTCARLVPGMGGGRGRKGYSHLPTSGNGFGNGGVGGGGGGGRGARDEQENRLIDQLDEEWED